MNKFLPLALSACVLTISAHAADIMPYNEAITAAKAQNKDIILLCIGSDWLPTSASSQAAFKSAMSKLGANANNAIWAIYDAKDSATKDERKAAGKPPVDIWGYPALFYVDSQNRVINYVENVTASDLTKTSQYFNKFNGIRTKRDEVWKKAQTAQGKEKAILLGQGLDLVLDPMDDAQVRRVRGNYKSVIEEIKKADAKDESGYVFKHTMWYHSLVSTILKYIKDKQISEGYRYLDQKLAIKFLTPYQKQLCLVGKYKLALTEADIKNGTVTNQAKFKEAMDFLAQAEKIAPKTVFGINCGNQRNFYTLPVTLDDLHWGRADNRPLWTPTSVDASSVIKDSGKYKIQFAHTGGDTKFRNPSVLTGKSVFSNATGKNREFVLDVPTKPTGKVTLKFDMMGTGWFEGQGDIIITKM